MGRNLRWLVMGVALLALLNWRGTLVLAQEELKAGATGTVVGVVTDITDEYVRITPVGETPYRYWFTWVSSANKKVDGAIEAAVSKFKLDDQVEVRWSFDDRKRIEAVKLVKAAPVAESQPVAVLPVTAARGASAAAPAKPLPSGNTTGDWVNALIDNLLATGNRLLELPLLMLLAAMGAAASVMALVIERILRRGQHFRSARFALAALGVMVLLGGAGMVDRKIGVLQNEVSELRTKTSAQAAAVLSAVSTQAGKEPAAPMSMVDPAEVRKNLLPQFGEVSLRPLAHDEAMEVMQVQMQKPLAQVYLAVIDLRNPAIEVKVAGDFNNKTLTSVFAKANDCTVAINGEAGSSPAPGSGLGPWRGFMVRQGQMLLQEDPGIQRPFLLFDRQNRAAFRAQASVDRALPAEAYNVMWGRLDALVNGQVQTADENFRQPRTGMAINQEGTRLYLMVVDGRQPNYSMGFTRAEVGHFLKAFGASDGMLCDEGGSSCIYVKQFGGISNIPSDNQGEERSTYTHFGIALSKRP